VYARFKPPFFSFWFGVEECSAKGMPEFHVLVQQGILLLSVEIWDLSLAVFHFGKQPVLPHLVLDLPPLGDVKSAFLPPFS
jgi:hypothetical protein